MKLLPQTRWKSDNAKNFIVKKKLSFFFLFCHRFDAYEVTVMSHKKEKKEKKKKKNGVYFGWYR